MMTVILCPCCQRPLEDGQTVPISHLRDIKLSRGHKVIVEALIDAYPRAVGIDHLIDRLYENDADGGPLNPQHVIRQMLSRIRSELPKHGWTVPVNTRGGGNYGSYRLEPLKEKR